MRGQTGSLRRQDLAIALALVGLAALLRLPRLIETPGWDGDEGYNLEIAWQLLQGRGQAFALSQSFVQHPPLFYALLTPVLALTGKDLWAARALAAAAGALATGLVYLAAVHLAGRRAAVLAGLAMAAVHFFVLYSRFAYTYNLLLLWTALTLFCECRWTQTRRVPWLAAATVAAALGLCTDQVGVALPVFVALRALPTRRLALATLVGGVAPAVLVAGLVFVLDPIAAAQDWGQSFARVAGRAPGEALSALDGPGVRLAIWFLNGYHLLRAEWWWPAAVIGAFAVPDLGARRRLLLLGALIAAPVFALREIEPFFRTAVPLLVPAAIGLGTLLDRGFEAAYRTAGADRRLPAAALTALVVLLPLGLEIGRSAGANVAGFRTRFDWALVEDTESARAAAEYVNARVGQRDVVLTSPHVAWLYRGQVADFFQAVAWTGEPIAFYPRDTTRARFRFDPSHRAARYAVLDSFWQRWTEASDPLLQMTREMERWPEVARFGDYSVRSNPNV